jgi:anti-anti-sigma factor
MELAVHDLDSGILGISLSGRMDIIGTQQIDLKFTALTSTRKAQILVDLSNVTFIASIGIRTLITTAKAQKARGGTMFSGPPALTASFRSRTTLRQRAGRLALPDSAQGAAGGACSRWYRWIAHR